MVDLMRLKGIWEVSLPVMVVVIFVCSVALFVLVFCRRQCKRAQLKEISTDNSVCQEQQSADGAEPDSINCISELLKNVVHGPVPERYRYIKLLLNHGMESDEIADIMDISKQEAIQLHTLFGICKNDKKIN